MIIYLIFLLVIVVILSWTLINNRTWRWLIGLTSSIALVAAVSIMTLNFSNHYGMKKKPSLKRTKSIQQLVTSHQCRSWSPNNWVPNPSTG